MRIALANVPFDAEQIRSLALIAADGGAELVYFQDGTVLSPEALAGFDALMGYFPPKVVAALPGVRWMQTPSAGVDHLRGAFDPHATVLTNGSGAFGIPIAEYLMAGLLMLNRKMPAYLRNQKAHLWRDEGPGRSIYGSLVTVVGMGNLGGELIRRLRAMGARVRGVRRGAAEKPTDLEAVYPASRLGEAVEGADAVALCLPATAETEKLVDNAVLRRMKKGAILLNAGRGATVDERALIRALKEGHLGGAVLDVTAEEPLGADSPLWDMDNVILTPHISGADGDPISAAILYDIFRDNLGRFLSGAPLRNVVDPAAGY
jgi:phosphoglycerate dehydrogenase-like enzyme